MQSFYRNIGKGTDYEFDSYDMKSNILGSNWFDKIGNEYILSKNLLTIYINSELNDSKYTIINYINDIPENEKLDIVFKFDNLKENILIFNSLCNILSLVDSKRNIVIDITNLIFSENAELNFDSLKSNVKISSMLNNKLEEKYNFSNLYFESWMMNCDEERFSVLIQKLTPNTLARIKRMREICTNFYRRTPVQIKNAKNLEKTIYAYKWISANIGYDFSANNSDGTLKPDRVDSQDPILTLEHKKGTSVGKSRLLKLLLNNHYMKVPCFLVNGKVGNKQHTWNEILLEDDSTVEFDLSNQNNKLTTDHNDLAVYNESLNNGYTKRLK